MAKQNGQRNTTVNVGVACDRCYGRLDDDFSGACSEYFNNTSPKHIACLSMIPDKKQNITGDGK